MDGRSIKIEPVELVECIPSECLQLEYNGCHRCKQRASKKQALRKENADLKQLVEKLKTYLAMPLNPSVILPVAITPQLKKCSVCQTEYTTNGEQKHICNGEHQIGCEYCEQVFTSTMDLIEHSNAYHSTNSFYCCTKCPEMFSMAQLLQFHELTHPITEPIYFCNIKDELDEHHDTNHKRPRRTKDSKNQMTSEPPSLLFISQVSDNSNIDKSIVRPRTKPAKKAETAKVKQFKCTKCSECFKTSKKVTVHIKRVHYKPKSSARSFECYICKGKYKSQHSTQIHMRQHIRTEKCAVCQELYTNLELEAHICCGLKSINCGYCQQAFTTTKSLLQHLQECKSEKVSYACGQRKCSKYFLMKLLADLHRENHKDTEPPKKYVCSTCGNGFNCPRQLKCHIERHNESRDYLCDQCAKSFLCEANLRLHKRTHNKKAITCSQCNFTCLGMTAYKRHLLRHQNIKFVCNICDLHLISAQKLAIHKKIHTRTEADRVHGCTQCDKKFFTKKTARAHFLAAHNTIRFECDMCDQSYKHKGDLNKHKRAVHSVGYSYACPHCERRFAQSYELDKHLFEHSTVSVAEQLLAV